MPEAVPVRFRDRHTNFDRRVKPQQLSLQTQETRQRQESQEMKENGRVSVGIFSVRADQWDQFLEMMVDSSDNFSTWERWRIQVDETKLKVAKNGFEVVEIEVDLNEFSAWCAHEDLELNGPARSRYASEMLRKRNT